MTERFEAVIVELQQVQVRRQLKPASKPLPEADGAAARALGGNRLGIADLKAAAAQELPITVSKLYPVPGRDPDRQLGGRRLRQRLVRPNVARAAAAWLCLHRFR